MRVAAKQGSSYGNGVAPGAAVSAVSCVCNVASCVMSLSRSTPNRAMQCMVALHPSSQNTSPLQQNAAPSFSVSRTFSKAQESGYIDANHCVGRGVGGGKTTCSTPPYAGHSLGSSSCSSPASHATTASCSSAMDDASSSSSSSPIPRSSWWCVWHRETVFLENLLAAEG